MKNIPTRQKAQKGAHTQHFLYAYVQHFTIHGAGISKLCYINNEYERNIFEIC